LDRNLPNQFIPQHNVMPGKVYLIIHGHFYQPPRWDPITGEIPQEFGADPYNNFNEKVNAECYRPNARAGNFERISFDLGPTLAEWLENNDPETYRIIIEADRKHTERFGYGNALAQGYNHIIMPLATRQEKRIQVAWGIADFEHRFGRRPEGMWLPETAVDYETLELVADFGVTYTVLSPSQAASNSIDPSEPYLVRLPNEKSITTFFYESSLSGGVSFEPSLTINANVFSAEQLPRHVNWEKLARSEPQLLLIATDGEVYGHHKQWRDQFLTYLLTVAAPWEGFEVASLAQYVHLFPPQREISIRESTSWSCKHGVVRWVNHCDCINEGNTQRDGGWKWGLRHALTRLASRIDAIYEENAGRLLHDPWVALEDYLRIRLEDMTWSTFWDRHALPGKDDASRQPVERLLEAEYYRHFMLTSCAFFFEDLDRIEPRNNIAYATRAIALVRAATGSDLAPSFIGDLSSTRSWRSGRTGADLLRSLPTREKAKAERAA